ncbi:hypothetical protein CupriaWKF_00170 [Cupriavidus sp. WKF15]|uniref:hypothetical protein n=1 Tax=Cupriavidus sp. WKF15 TaxID=3032282 RepID=UPI0023E288C4|nr:hypothetical protein [Cupriavidus sp. WKF15]WER46046.1 hypothetical protein CupriaWKF_00170 [Cupriavidus sp. WKF15]
MEFIRHFTEDYNAKPQFLVENYRSSGNIIDVANAIIQPASERMKAEQSITIDRARRRLPAGDAWEVRDPVARGRVQVLPACESPTHQALAAITELQRLSELDADWKWSHCAVIAREWRYTYNRCRRIQKLRKRALLGKDLRGGRTHKARKRNP